MENFARTESGDEYMVETDYQFVRMIEPGDKLVGSPAECFTKEEWLHGNGIFSETCRCHNRSKEIAVLQVPDGDGYAMYGLA